MDVESLSYWVAVVVGVVTAAALAWSAVRYVRVRQAEIRQQRFENIHGLIKGYANWSPSGHTTPMPLAPQLAATFEFRNYPEYRNLFVLLLQHHKFQGPNADLLNALVQEAIDHIDKKPWWRVV